MVGRPRKAGKREKNGRVSRALGDDKPMRYMDGCMDNPTAIYVMEAAPLVKIGFSVSPKGRTGEVQTSNGSIVRLAYYRWLDGPNAKKLEQHFHKQYRGTVSHSHGEWYYMTPGTAIEAIEGMIRRLSMLSVHPSHNVHLERVFVPKKNSMEIA